MYCIVLLFSLSLICQCEKTKKAEKTKSKQLKILVMKTQSTELFKVLSNTEMAKLTTVVKETVAPTVSDSTQRTFSAGELWSIQRRVKSASSRRQFV